MYTHQSNILCDSISVQHVELRAMPLILSLRNLIFCHGFPSPSLPVNGHFTSTTARIWYVIIMASVLVSKYKLNLLTNSPHCEVFKFILPSKAYEAFNFLSYFLFFHGGLQGSLLFAVGTCKWLAKFCLRPYVDAPLLGRSRLSFYTVYIMYYRFFFVYTYTISTRTPP